MQNIKITIEYDGTNFFGWQKQPNLRTVQGVIESSLTTILQENIKVTGASRTDKGVHAIAQVANFFSNTKLILSELLYRLNRLLPYDVKIKSIRRVDKKFNARYKAKSKLYKYTILNSRIPSPLERMYSWYLPYKLDIPKIREAKDIFIGTHNFKSFATAGSSVRTYVRTIRSISIRKQGKFIDILINGEGFLKNMVRNIVGLLIEVGKGNIELDEVRKILDSKDRGNVPKSAPSCGLFLVKVRY